MSFSSQLPNNIGWHDACFLLTDNVPSLNPGGTGGKMTVLICHILQSEGYNLFSIQNSIEYMNNSEVDTYSTERWTCFFFFSTSSSLPFRSINTVNEDQT